MSIIGWKEIYTHTVTGAAETSITIPDLHGDVDLEYKLEARIVNGYNGASVYQVRPNNVSTDVYGSQVLYGYESTIGATRVTTGAYGWTIGANAALNNISQSTTIIQAKSGYIRTAITEETRSIATTTIGELDLFGFSWNNTVDEITSLVVLADQANGLGIGSVITLSARAVLTVTTANPKLEWVTP